MFKIKQLTIENYKSIKKLDLFDLPKVCVFVGKNNTGKSVILEAIDLFKFLFMRSMGIPISAFVNPIDTSFSYENIRISITFTNNITEEFLKIEIHNSLNYTIKSNLHIDMLSFLVGNIYLSEDINPYSFLKELSRERGSFTQIFGITYDPKQLIQRTPEEVFYVDKEDGFTTVIQASRLKAVQELYKNGDNMTDIWRQGFLEKEAQKFFGFVDK